MPPRPPSILPALGLFTGDTMNDAEPTQQDYELALGAIYKEDLAKGDMRGIRAIERMINSYLPVSSYLRQLVLINVASRMTEEEWRSAIADVLTQHFDAPTHCPTCSQPVDAGTGFCTYCGEQ